MKTHSESACKFVYFQEMALKVHSLRTSFTFTKCSPWNFTRWKYYGRSISSTGHTACEKNIPPEKVQKLVSSPQADGPYPRQDVSSCEKPRVVPACAVCNPSDVLRAAPPLVRFTSVTILSSIYIIAICRISRGNFFSSKF